MGTTLLSIIGTLLVFILGLLLYLVRSTREDINLLKKHMDNSLAETRDKILERVHRPDCIREMDNIRLEIKETVRDIKDLERKR